MHGQIVWCANLLMTVMDPIEKKIRIQLKQILGTRFGNSYLFLEPKHHHHYFKILIVHLKLDLAYRWLFFVFLRTAVINRLIA